MFEPDHHGLVEWVESAIALVDAAQAKLPVVRAIQVRVAHDDVVRPLLFPGGIKFPLQLLRVGQHLLAHPVEWHSRVSWTRGPRNVAT
jgi:hypothetical protein